MDARGADTRHATGGRPSAGDATARGDRADTFAERPEVFVGAAFAGGLALALSQEARRR